MEIMRGKRVAYRNRTSPMGYHGLIDRSGMPLLSHAEGGRFITSRESTVWISVRAWRGREGRSGIPDARARASTSLSLRPSRMLAPRRATRVPTGSFLCGAHCIIFFLYFDQTSRISLSQVTGKTSERLCNFKSCFLRIQFHLR